MSPSIDELVRQLVESCVVLYHAVDVRVHTTSSHTVVIDKFYSKKLLTAVTNGICKRPLGPLLLNKMNEFNAS